MYLSHLGGSNSGPTRYECVALPTELRRHEERVKGIEPSPQPWEGRILPLYYTRARMSASPQTHIHQNISILFGSYTISRASLLQKISKWIVNW